MSYYNQSIIVNKLKKLGYLEENLDGHCYGFSNMARNAFLDGNIEQFHHDINILFKLTNTDIEAIKTSPIASSIELESGETVEILDILAFCDGITLFQRPYDYIELLSEDPNQYINQIGNAAEGMLTPMTLEQDNTRSELAQRMHGCYTADDLVGVFSALQQKVCKAAKSGDVSAIESILGITSCINRLNDDGKSPLHIAAKKGHVEFAQALLDRGADINFVDKKQRSALYHAVDKGNIEMIRWLLDNGANINIADKKGISPADLAQQSNDINVKALFSNAVDDVTEVIDTSEESANTDNWHEPARNTDNQRSMRNKLKDLRTCDDSSKSAEDPVGMQRRH